MDKQRAVEESAGPALHQLASAATEVTALGHFGRRSGMWKRKRRSVSGVHSAGPAVEGGSRVLQKAPS